MVQERESRVVLTFDGSCAWASEHKSNFAEYLALLQCPYGHPILHVVIDLDIALTLSYKVNVITYVLLQNY